MPTAITEIPPRWTRSACASLEASGLWEQQKPSSIEGELSSKIGKKRPHVNSVALLAEWLAETFGFRFVNVAAPIDVAREDNPTNEPEPDLIVLTRDSLHFRSGNLLPEDL